jgi:hypothetical protein
MRTFHQGGRVIPVRDDVCERRQSQRFQHANQKRNETAERLMSPPVDKIKIRYRRAPLTLMARLSPGEAGK